MKVNRGRFGMVAIRSDARRWGAYVAIGIAAVLMVSAGSVTLPRSASAPAPAALAQISPGTHYDQKRAAPVDNDTSFFGVVGRYHDTIEAIAAVGGVFAAVWLAIVTGFLYGATKDLSVTTEDLAEGATKQVYEMQKARIIAERQLEFIEKQLDLSEKQFLLAGRQCDLGEKQQAIARLQYYADNRPKLVLKDVYFNMDGLLTFEIANIGGIPATITDGWAAIGHVADERWFKLRTHGEMHKEELAGRQFAVGELKTLTAKHSGRIGLELLAPTQLVPLRSEVFFYGAFHYVDDRGSEFSATRLAVFRRQWSPGDHAFYRTGNDDHEYSH